MHRMLTSKDLPAPPAEAALAPVSRALADGDVKGAAAAMPGGGLREAYDMQPEARLREPLRNEPAKNAALFSLPEIAVLLFPGLAAFSGEDKRVAEAIRLAARKEAPKYDVGILLPQAVKIEPGLDWMVAPCNPLADAWIEGRMRRRRRRAARRGQGGRLCDGGFFGAIFGCGHRWRAGLLPGMILMKQRRPRPCQRLVIARDISPKRSLFLG